MQVGKSLDDHTVAESEPIYIIIKDLNYSISEYKGKTIIKAEYFCINPIWNIGNAKTTIIREINFIDRVENMIAHDKLLKPEE